MKTILITGAAGFIGSNLAYKLYKEGNRLILIDDFSYGREVNLKFIDIDFNEIIYRKSILDVEAMEDIFSKNKIDVVYHLAAISVLPDCQNNPIKAVDVNVKGTVVLLEMSRKYGIKNFIFASSSAVYENNTSFPLVENNVELPSLLYPSTKYMSEQLCKSYYDTYGLPTVCLRFTNVYGPHIDCLRKQPPVMGYIIKSFYEGTSPVLHSTGEQQRDFIYIDDLLDLAILVQKNKEFDVVNISTGQTASINEIANIIRKQMNCENIEIKYQSSSHYWDKYKELSEGVYPINKERLEHEVLKYTCLSYEHAYKKYKWEPKVSLEEGIKNTINFSVSVLKGDSND